VVQVVHASSPHARLRRLPPISSTRAGSCWPSPPSSEGRCSVKHEFRDELKIKVDHEHEIDPDVVKEVIDKVVDGAVTIIVVSTVSHFIKKYL
jgi:hypothetical protein